VGGCVSPGCCVSRFLGSSSTFNHAVGTGAQLNFYIIGQYYSAELFKVLFTHMMVDGLSFLSPAFIKTLLLQASLIFLIALTGNFWIHVQ